MAACDGRCVGVGYSNYYVRGKCPKPCDDKEYKHVDPKNGHTAAKDDANTKCKKRSENDECVCHGDESNYSELKKECVTSFAVEDDVVVEYCEYRIWYQFEGNCKKPA